MTSGSLNLSLSADLPPARLATLTREIGHDLTRIGASTAPAESKPGLGERGVITEIGKLIVNGLGGKIAADALDVFKAFFVREHSLSIALTRPDGAKIEITAKNVGNAEVAAFLGLAKTALE